MARQSTPLVWAETANPDGTTDRKPQLPATPAGQYLAWASVDETAGEVYYEFADIPPDPPDPPSP